jgi:N-acetyl-alpha-D-muramate 1-phosphate uridylyltransferase
MITDLPSIAILAGGLGTRLSPLTDRLPKALVEVHGKPFIEHQLESLGRAGFRRVIICAGFMGDWIFDCIGEGHRFGLKVEYSFDGSSLLGTGGAIQKALPMLGNNFFVVYGDSYLQCDYREIFEAFTNSGKAGLMTVFQNNGLWDRSNVEFAKGRIVSYSKQHLTPSMTYIDYGSGVFRKEVFLEECYATPFDLSRVYQDLLAAGELHGFEVRNRFYEIGSFQGIEDLANHFHYLEQA